MRLPVKWRETDTVMMVISDYGNRSFDDFNENDDGVVDDYQQC